MERWVDIDSLEWTQLPGEPDKEILIICVQLEPELFLVLKRSVMHQYQSLGKPN